MRRAEDKRWSSDRIKELKGSPMEPVPGSGQSRVTAFAKTKERTVESEARYVRPPEKEEPEVKMAYIYRSDVEKYGPTPGCPGCRAAKNPAGSFRAKHTAECRKRFEDELSKTGEGKKRYERAEDRMNKVVTKKFEDIVEGNGASGSRINGK